MIDGDACRSPGLAIFLMEVQEGEMALFPTVNPCNHNTLQE